MEKKTIATTISVILVIILIAIIGSTLAYERVDKNKIEVKAIDIVNSEGIIVTNKKKKVIDSLEIKSNEIGVRPSTGRQDSKTNIPSTVNDTISTEGAYGIFLLTSDKPYKISLIDAYCTNGDSENRDNVFIGVMDDKSEAISIDKIGNVLSRGDSANEKEIIIVAWLDGDATGSLKGADIYFKIKIDYE